MKNATERPLLTALNCVRPLIFRNNNVEFPWSIAGTCFLVEYLRRPFVVTAKHNLENHSRTPQEVSVQYNTQQSEMLSFCRAFVGREQDDPESEAHDFVVLQVDLRRLSIEKWEQAEPMLLTPDDIYSIQSPAQPYAAAGYARDGINYELKNIQTTRYNIGLEYAQLWKAADITSFQVRRDPRMPDFDGLSGSPVIQVVHIDHIRSTPFFAGMILRGTLSSGTVHAISNRFLVSKLEDICLENEIPTLDD